MPTISATCPFLRAYLGSTTRGALSNSSLIALGASCPHLKATGLSPASVLERIEFKAQPVSTRQTNVTKPGFPVVHPSSQLADPLSGKRAARLRSRQHVPNNAAICSDKAESYNSLLVQARRAIFPTVQNDLSTPLT